MCDNAMTHNNMNMHDVFDDKKTFCPHCKKRMTFNYVTRGIVDISDYDNWIALVDDNTTLKQLSEMETGLYRLYYCEKCEINVIIHNSNDNF